jgi:hypothetical protein
MPPMQLLNMLQTRFQYEWVVSSQKYLQSNCQSTLLVEQRRWLETGHGSGRRADVDLWILQTFRPIVYRNTQSSHTQVLL